MNGALLTAVERIEREKGISKEILFEAIESALVSAARKVIDDPEISKEDITVTMDQETGEITVFAGGEVVENDRFGRIAAQTAKQVIIQKIREAERDVIFEKYEKKVGVIVSGAVHRFEKGNVIIELDDAEALLPKSGQIPRERFRQGEQIRAYLWKVERGTGGPEIILSRTDVGFVKKLFEMEVPEISQGIVEIKSVAREAGERTKIAVSSKEEKVDPVGACVGMRGSRVRDIVKELHGERIDIVRWDNDIRAYLKAAVSPAEISQMVVDRENKSITLVVAQDQLSLLIGKKGRNIRLASRLLGWELVAESTEVVWEIPISEVQGIGEKTLKTLEAADFDSVEKVQQSGVEGLLELDGIGQKTAEKIIAACEEAAAQLAAQEAEEAEAEEPEVAEEEVEAAEEEEVEVAEEEAVKEEPGSEETPEEEGTDEDVGSDEETSEEEEADSKEKEEEK
ncbi:MAG: transcription termination factor NusA [Candidatus Omnitrophota bacterium]